jgi:hypothetical protein
VIAATAGIAHQWLDHKPNYICEALKPSKVMEYHFLTYKLVYDLQVSFASVADKAAP